MTIHSNSASKVYVYLFIPALRVAYIFKPQKSENVLREKPNNVFFLAMTLTFNIPEGSVLEI